MKNKQFNYETKAIGVNEFSDTPESYQHYVVRIMAMQAYAERCGATEVGAQLSLAPDSALRVGLAKIVSDEAIHAHMLYQVLEDIGVSETKAIEIVNDKHQKTKSLDGVEAVGDSNNTWLDIVLNNMLMDRAGGFMVRNFAKSSFKPWATACEKIAKDEDWHQRFGWLQFLDYIELHGIDSAKARFHYWYVHALNFFGPPNNKSDELLKNYGIKRENNQVLRENFISDLTSLLANHDLDFLLEAVTDVYPYKLNKEAELCAE